VVEVTSSPGSAAWRRSIGSGFILWVGTLALGLSTVVLLALLTRHKSLAGVAALLALAFVASLIPAGLQLRAAALVVDGGRLPRIAPRILVSFTVIGLAVAPGLALLLKLPVLSIVFVVLQVLIAIPLSISRGAWLGTHRFSALGTNMVIEAVARVGLGALGWWFAGITGLSAGITASIALVFLFARHRHEDAAEAERPLTSLLDTSLTLGLLGLLTQLDILVVPSGLGTAAAAHYDLAAVPSKGVYLVLLAAGPFAFPFVRRDRGRRLIAVSALLTLSAGLVVTALLVLFRGQIGIILGQNPPGPFLLLALGAAMSCAGTTNLILNAEVARGVRRPWPPLFVGIAVIVIAWATRPTPSAFAAAVLAGQLASMLTSLVVCLRVARKDQHHGQPPPVA
jgi:hypothetical protein